MFRGDEQVVLKGVVYSAEPLAAIDGFALDSCALARDFPLLKALGANSVLVEQRLANGSAAVSEAGQTNGLYWIAGFPLQQEITASTDLSHDSTRRRILDEFENYADQISGDPRLVAISFGSDTAVEYERLTGRNPRDFYSLLAAAAARLRSRADPILVTSAVADPSEIGAFAWGSDDLSQPQLSFWTVVRPGTGSLRSTAIDARARTNKPILFSGIGIDAFNSRFEAEDTANQAAVATELGRELLEISADPALLVLGGFWGEFSDQWWRAGAPGRHNSTGTRAAEFPDRSAEPEWFGLFGRRQDFGGPTLRARPAYFALAEVWAGTPPRELTDPAVPLVDQLGFVNAATAAPLVAPGSLVELHGVDFSETTSSASVATNLPRNFGATSVCVGGDAIPLYSAGPDVIRGVLPRDLPLGTAQAVVYRAGKISNAVTAEVRESAPGILPRGVFRPVYRVPSTATTASAREATLRSTGPDWAIFLAKWSPAWLTVRLSFEPCSPRRDSALKQSRSSSPVPYRAHRESTRPTSGCRNHWPRAASSFGSLPAVVSAIPPN